MTLYSVREAAELIGVTYKRLWYAVRVGDIKESHRVGRYRLFDDYDIVEIRRHFNIQSNDASEERANTFE